MTRKIEWNVKIRRTISLEENETENECGFGRLSWANNEHPECLIARQKYGSRA